MLFASVVFTTFLVVVFSVAFFATDLSPVTAGFAVGFTVVEAAGFTAGFVTESAGFVAVVALPVVADFAAVALVLDFTVLVDFVALTGLASVTGFVDVAGFATLTGFALGLAIVDAAVDLETVLVIVPGFAAGLVASGRKLDFFVVFTFDTVVLDTVDFGVGFFVTTAPLFCSVAPCAIEAPPMFTPKNKVAIIINCNRFVFIVISLSVKYLNAHRLI